MIVVAYDVADDRRRSRLRRRLLEYGTPVQESVFECFATKAMWGELKKAVQQIAVGDEDLVR